VAGADAIVLRRASDPAFLLLVRPSFAVHVGRWQADARRNRSAVGGQRLRPLLDRDRSVELAHRRADARRQAVRGAPRSRRAARPRRRGDDRPVRVARRQGVRARHRSCADDEGVLRFLLVAGAIGSVFKETASISGAEVGCQGEVGSACAMAAAGLCEVLGGTPAQVENAAEIAMEHNLGLTCDPVRALVQVPCIERNAIALRGDGTHIVSLDAVIATMRQIGADMSHKDKETSLGGLAGNVVACWEHHEMRHR
jgi:hypothetical protein